MDNNIHNPNAIQMNANYLNFVPIKAKTNVVESQDTLARSETDNSQVVYGSDSQCSLQNNPEYLQDQKWATQREKSEVDSEEEVSRTAPLRKWKSEFLSVQEPLVGKLKKYETSFFPTPTENPLKKWKTLYKSSVSSDLVECESEEDSPNPPFPSTESSQGDVCEANPNPSLLTLLEQTRNSLKLDDCQTPFTKSSSEPILKESVDDSHEMLGMNSIEELFDNQEDNEFDHDVEAMYQIRRFQKKYKVIRQIGSGGHSVVKLAERRIDSNLVVTKFIHSSNVWHWHALQDGTEIPMEIAIMEKFNQINLKQVARLLEYYRIGERYILVIEYLGADWIDLYDYIEFFGPVNEEHTRQIFRSVVETVQTIHSLGYCHNDIKDENVMINKFTREIKLIDFGSTMPLAHKPTTTFYGTQKFSAPEALNGNSYYPSHQESWALGTLLYVLLFKMDPFANDDEILDLEISKRIERIRTTQYGKNLPPIEISDEAADAMCLMLSKDPEQRPRIEEITKLPFFSLSQ